MNQAFQFADVLEKDGAFSKLDWHGLDYGCGFGRMTTAMLSKGAPAQLDLCDAWESTLNVIGQLGYQNRIFKVSELVREVTFQSPHTISFFPSQSSRM